MASLKRRDTGVFEVEPGLFELRAPGGRDPLTGKYRQITKRFRGTFRHARTERAKLVTRVAEGRYAGTAATVDELAPQWLTELERKGRSPRTVHEYRRRYRHDIQAALGSVPVSKVTTRMLTDLYGAHQARGASPGSVRKIHATISSMMSQACRWGWRDTNPAEWAEPPPLDSVLPVVPTPTEVVALLEAAGRSQRPEHAEVIYLAATTGARRGEICALRLSHLDAEAAGLRIERNIVVDQETGELVDKVTKNRRRRAVALDARSVEILTGREADARAAAKAIGVDRLADPYLFARDPRGATSWHPDTITQYFARLADRVDLGHIEFKSLRKFMDTYAQEIGYSLAQAALRAGHDPAVAGKHYTGRVDETDRRLAADIGELLANIDTGTTLEDG